MDRQVREITYPRVTIKGRDWLIRALLRGCVWEEMEKKVDI